MGLDVCKGILGGPSIHVPTALFSHGLYLAYSQMKFWTLRAVWSIIYLLAERERDPEALLINAVIVSDPTASFASQWH